MFFSNNNNLISESWTLNKTKHFINKHELQKIVMCSIHCVLTMSEWVGVMHIPVVETKTFQSTFSVGKYTPKSHVKDGGKMLLQ